AADQGRTPESGPGSSATAGCTSCWLPGVRRLCSHPHVWMVLWTDGGSTGGPSPMSEAPELWRRCAALLRAQVSDLVWHTSFEGVRAVEFDGRTLTLGVSSPLAKERIEGRYLGLVRDALAEAGAPGTELRLQIESAE